MTQREYPTTQAAAVGMLTVAALLCMGLFSCSKESAEKGLPRGEIVATFGDSILRVEDVVNQIPVGLPESDSLALFHSITQAWVSNMLLEDIAQSSNMDMAQIERMVSQYRSSLIVEQYRRKMRNSHISATDDAKIKKFYQEHPEFTNLETPIVKGLMLKVESDFTRLPELRRWMSRCSASDMDNIERYGLENTLDYLSFQDTWIDWNTVASQIPHRISNPRKWLETNKNLETTKGDVTYLLHITEYLDSGAKMPYDYARTILADRLSASSAEDYENNLLNQLYTNAVKSGKLQLSSGRYLPDYVKEKNSAK